MRHAFAGLRPGSAEFLLVPAWLCAVLLAFFCPPMSAADGAVAVEPTLLERAYVLDEGVDVPRDAGAAAALYRQAAASGDAHALLRLGYLTETGDGVPQDYAVARTHYQAAVDAGLVEARVRLAICHLEGWGGPVDRPAFAREIRTAAEAGYLPAQRILASLCFLGFAVPVDRAEAVKWLELAARQDDAASQYRLGVQAEKMRRKNLTPDLTLARTWYELSAEQEYHASLRAMARTFLSAPRQERNWALGHRWLVLAADNGDAEAGFILAVCELLHPDSPLRNVDQARTYLQTASSRGNMRATEVLQLEIGGRSLADSLRYVLSEPMEERYVTWMNSKAHNDGPKQRPQVYRVVRPIFPQALRFAETQGKVIIEFIIDSTGRVKNPKAIESPHPLFTERALEAIVQWRFHPARIDGRPVNTRARLPVEFSLAQEELSGVDGLIAAAVSLATKLGTVPEADYREIRLAKPKTKLPPPRMPDGSALPTDARVLILLALDPSGKPLRGYVLDARPEAVGPGLLASLLTLEYEPRIIAGEAVPSNVIYRYVARPRNVTP